MRITGGAVEAMCDLTYRGKQISETHARLLLDAALPHLEGATPVADREHMIEVLGGSELAAATVDHLLSAGVFRDGATPAIDREALWDAISDVRDAYPRLSNDAPTDDIIDAILPLIGGAS
jgi:hypothetical protein